MRLTTRKASKKLHQDIASAVVWTHSTTQQEEDIYSWSDETIVKCNAEGNAVQKVDLPSLNSIVICADRLHQSHSSMDTDAVLLGCADGKLYLYSSKFTRLEKVIEAHTGGVLAVKWCKDGNSFVSSGEDGLVRSWSRAGLPRANITQTDSPVNAIGWLPDQKSIVFSSNRSVYVKSILNNDAPMQWKAHEAFITALGVDPVTGTIVSAPEDGRYKLWDRFGKLLYTGNRISDSVQSISWHPNGRFFVMGGFDKLLLCGYSGHLLSTTMLESSGSVFDLEWNASATYLSCSCGSGDIYVAAVDDIFLQWNQFEVSIQNSTGIIHVKDSVEGTVEKLDVKRPVLCSSLGYNHLILATSEHIYLYRLNQWNTPLIVDSSKLGQMIDIQQTYGYFLIIDTVIGIQVFSYEARLVSSVKHGMIYPDYLNGNMVSLSPDSVVVISSQTPKSVLLFDISGRPVGEQPIYTHTKDIVKIAVEQSSAVFGPRVCAFVDSASSLFLIPLSVSSSQLAKQDKQLQSPARSLCPFVSSFAWNQSNSTLCAISDDTLRVWYHPSICFIDEDLLESVTASSADLQSGLHLPSGTGWQNSQIISFSGTNCVLSKPDGAIGYVAGLQSFPAVLAQLAKSRDWIQSVKLCRFVNRKELWSCLAGLSLQMHEYDTAEVAYAVLEEVKKVRWICKIKEEKLGETKQAELALFRRNPMDSETILLGSGQLFRCIYTWLELYNWNRALDLAVKYNKFLEIVLYMRKKYLEDLGQPKETNPKFQAHADKLSSMNDTQILGTIETEKRKCFA